MPCNIAMKTLGIWLFIVCTAALQREETFFPNLGVFQDVSINPVGYGPKTRTLPLYVQQLYEQIEQNEDDLRMYPDRDPRVQFYSAIRTGKSDGVVEFDLNAVPVHGDVTRVEVAFTEHIRQLPSLKVTSQYKPGIVVNTIHKKQCHVADITNLIMDQMSNTTLRLHVNGAEGQVQYLNSTLAVFLDLKISYLRMRRKRFVFNLPKNKDDCSLKPWTVNFKDLHWYPKLFQFPETYQANVCVGNCHSPLLNAYVNTTNHSLLKSLLNKRICCVPIEYQSQALIFQTKNATVIHSVKGMRVTRCGCR
ncbi:uncharacterized protein LOC133200817 [Saccostrea echinata]|uniref:uncharacterized protein LOC133200817 n=1 Tax=Saccostrea echinata TaxID=191078 RepID=UPI002A836C22|nr:uncharacterized protein LOC133200817 [Saccostrea echinata]